MALIAMLIAILLPSLAKVRDRARGAQCLVNLDQQGVAAFMYAYERGGSFPAAASQDIDPPESVLKLAALPRDTARVLVKMVARASTVFYCPANKVDPYKPSDFDASVASPPSNPLDACILYWWLANPIGDNATRFLDSDGDGLTTDEYIRRIEARRISDIVISTDQSRQEFPQVQDGLGWYFFHGEQGLPRGVINTDGLTAWKNNLYGDGHVSLVRAPWIIPRWGPDNRVGW